MKRGKLPTIIVATDPNGKEQKHKSLNIACEAHGLNTKSVYQHFNRHKGASTYISKTGITLTKTTLL